MSGGERVVWVAEAGDGRLHRLEGDPLTGPVEQTDEVVEPVGWLPPVEPRAIICIGLNYGKHAAEGQAKVPDEPVIFMKNPAAAIGHGQAIRLPEVCGDEVDYECELVVVLGKTCRNVGRAEALDYVFGYTIGNDVSARSWQLERGGGQWVRGKSFDTFAPLGPVVVTKEELTTPGSLALRTELNGKVMQSSNTSDMIFDVAYLIEFLSQDTTLLSGTVIMTGTLGGVGWFREPRELLRRGDTITMTIEGIGQLSNPVE